MISTRSKHTLTLLHACLFIPGMIIYSLKGNIGSTSVDLQCAELDSLVWLGIPDDMILSEHDNVPAWPQVNVFNAAKEEMMIIPTVKYSSTLCGETLERTWTVYNTFGETAVKTQSLLFLKENSTLFKHLNDTIIQCGEGIPVPPYQTLQVCGNFKVYLTEKIQPETACTYSLIRIWHIGDHRSNSSQYLQHIKVVDTIPPTITVTNPLLSLFPDGGEVVMFGNERPEFEADDVEIHDNCCDPDLQINYELLERAESEIMGSYRKWLVSFVATDLSSNSTSFSLNVIQYDSRNTH